mgnify:CR=1 FL=1
MPTAAPRRQFGREATHCLDDVRGVGLGFEMTQPVEVGTQPAQRLGEVVQPGPQRVGA